MFKQIIVDDTEEGWFGQPKYGTPFQLKSSSCFLSCRCRKSASVDLRPSENGKSES